jgi:hypothetical protein
MAAHMLFDRGVNNLDQSPYYDTAYQGMDLIVSELLKAGKKVVIVIDNPTLLDPRKCLPCRTVAVGPWRLVIDSSFNMDGCLLTYGEHLKRTKKYLDLVDALKRAHPQLVVYDPTHLLCDIPHNICPSREGSLFIRLKIIFPITPIPRSRQNLFRSLKGLIRV